MVANMEFFLENSHDRQLSKLLTGSVATKPNPCGYCCASAAQRRYTYLMDGESRSTLQRTSRTGCQIRFGSRMYAKSVSNHSIKSE